MFLIFGFIIPFLFWYFVLKAVNYKDKDELDNEEEDC